MKPANRMWKSSNELKLQDFYCNGVFSCGINTLTWVKNPSASSAADAAASLNLVHSSPGVLAPSPFQHHAAGQRHRRPRPAQTDIKRTFIPQTSALLHQHHRKEIHSICLHDKTSRPSFHSVFVCPNDAQFALLKRPSLQTPLKSLSV